jgi:hypothetical protein
MGYNGMGFQRWIATMKPRKFMGKRSKPDCGGVENNAVNHISGYYHLKSAKLDNLLKRKYPAAYKLKLQNELKRKIKSKYITILSAFVLQ